MSATDLILRLIEHEVPEYGLLHLLDLPQERLEIIELEVAEARTAAGRAVTTSGCPTGSLVISILRDGGGFVPTGDSVDRSGRRGAARARHRARAHDHRDVLRAPAP